jgi:hypothetical protein
MNTHKVDLRLTDEQYEWVCKQSKSATIGKSTFLRQVIEEIRKQDEAGTVPIAPASEPPKKTNGKIA